jgi:hypothetical protein
MRTQIRKQEWTPTRDLLPLILGKEPGEKLDKREINKLELFEKGLQQTLCQDDTIEQAVTKMVKLALAAEFGPSLVAAKGAKPMVATITRTILGDAQLRKQALLIIDRLAQ